MSNSSRSFILCWTLCLACFAIHAQGPSRTADAKPDYSKEAFVIEQDSTRVDFENDGTNTRELTTRVRIQADAGVQHWGVLTFPYESSTQAVDIDYVRVRKPDNSLVLTPADAIQDMPSEISRQAPLYSDLKEKQMAVKGLGVGDVLEFQSHWRTTKPLAPGQFWYAFSFSHDSIILQQQLEIRVPRERPVKWKSAGAQPVITEDRGRRIFTWTSAQLEHKSSEQENKEEQETLRQAVRGQLAAAEVQISSFQSWEEVGRWYGGLQLERVKPSPEVRAKAAELTKNAADETARIRAIYGYVSTQFRYIGIDFGIGRYQPHSATDVLSNQYGDCKDKHTLLASLLDATGIKTYPALISTRHAIDPDVPSPGQFDHVISVVPQGSSLLWLDTTPEVAPFAYLISPLRGKPALIVSEDKPPALVTTPEDSPAKALQTFRVKAKLGDTGTLDGKFERTVEGDDNEVLLRSAFRRVPLPNWKDLAQQISYASGYAGEVSDVTAGSPEKTDEPFHFAYNYTRKDYPDWSSRRISPPLPPIVMPGAGDDDKTPARSIWLGSPEEIHATSEVEIPKGYMAETPKKIDLDLSFAEYHASSSFKDGVLTTDRRIIFKRRELAVSDYESYKKFSKMVTDDHEAFVVLSTGSRPPAIESSYQEEIWQLPYSTNHEASAAYDEAREEFKKNDLAGEISSLKRAVELDPKFTRAWSWLGEVYKFRLQTDLALQAYRKAIEADPQQPVNYKALGTTLLVLGRFEDAIPVWQELIKVGPEDASGPSGLGAALLALKRYQEAVSTLEAAVKVNPQEAGIQRQLASAYIHAGDDVKALAAYQAALNLDSAPLSYNNAAYDLADAGKQIPAAMEFAKKAVNEEEEASLKTKLPELQVEDLGHANSLAAFWDTLGWVHFREGNFDEAAKYVNASWMLSQRAVAADHLGQVYEKQNKTAAAVKMYRLALAATPERLGQADGTKEIRARLQKLIEHVGTRGGANFNGGGELSQMRISKVARFAQGTSSAEVFLVLAWDSKTSEFKVEDWKFISGSEALKPPTQVLSAIHFTLSSPDGIPVHLVRRGILGCYQYTGCSLVLFDPDSVRSLN
jgi:tetratricopeptide (TPR) repeat protein